MGEGNTPLLKSRNIGPSLGLPNLYFKLENLNPTGSYKDRFAASAVAHLLGIGATACLATSSGNTGAALAAYCAAVQLPCILVLVAGAPEGKLQQMRVYGANTLTVQGFGQNSETSAKVMQVLDGLAHELSSPVQISAYAYSPEGMTGVQAIAYELAQQLRHQRVQVFVPAGGGGLCLAVARGFMEWTSNYTGYTLPKINCVQPIGNDTIASSLRNGLHRAMPMATCTTSISGLQVPNILDGDEVIAACGATQGNGYAVDDKLIYACQQSMAKQEGIYCEPAGAVALAGVIDALGKKEIDPREHLVCVVTGHGFKDPGSTARMAGENAAALLTISEGELGEHIKRIAATAGNR